MKLSELKEIMDMLNPNDKKEDTNNESTDRG